jgi:PAS domain S-box-containing protein
MNSPGPSTKTSNSGATPTLAQRIFGSGEMADLTRAFDWASTPVGPIEEWQDTLVTTVNLLLGNRHPMFLWWGDELIQFYNDGYRPSLGSDKHPKALGQHGRDCWPEIWAAIGPQIEGVMTRGDATWHEDQFLPIYREGRLVDVYWTYSYSPVRDPQGVIRGTLVTCSETTGRVVAEQKVRESEERLRLAQAVGGLATWEWDIASNRIVWSPGSAEVYGVPAEELQTAEQVVQRIHPEDRSSTLLVVDKAIRERCEYNHEFRVVIPDGSIRWLVGRGRPAYSPEGAPTRMLGVNWSITERKQAEDELRTERQRLLELFQQAPAFVAVLRGPEHVFELANPLYMELVGVRELIGKTVREAVPEAVDQGYGEILDQVYSTGMPFVAHGYRITLARGRDKTSEERILDFVYQPIQEVDGRVSGIIAFGVDVTERKRAEGALRDSEKLAAVGRLASSIAHEINNPLEAITNLLYLVEVETNPEQAKVFIALAQHEMARVANIVTQTLRFHRQSTRAKDVSLSDTIDGVITLFIGRAANCEVAITRQFRTNQKIVAYEGDLRQVFANLIANALDASSHNGHIVVRIREATDWSTGRKGVRVTTSDNGQGMSDETRRRMFEPFFTTKEQTGTGLGLWVTAEILQNHQAKVNVRSRVNGKHRGTTFSIFIPLDGVEKIEHPMLRQTITK